METLIPNNSTTPTPWILFFVAIIIIITTFFCIKNYLRRRRLPPGPIALPIIGHLHLLNSKLPSSLEALSAIHGPVMKISMAGTPVYVVSDPATAKHVLKHADFASRANLGFGLSHYDIYRDFGFVNAPNGPYWRFMKKLCMTELLVGPQLHRFIRIREEEASKLLKSLAGKSIRGEACDLGKELEALASRTICRMTIGKRCDEKAGEAVRGKLRAVMDAAARMSFVQVFGPLKWLDLFGNGKRLTAKLWEYDAEMERIMAVYEHREDEEQEGKDVMEILLEAYADPNAELKLAREHIKRFFFDIFLASVDTMGAVIEFSMAELINNPRILKKLRSKIHSVIGSKRVVKEPDVPNLPYLQAVIKETLRKHPAAPLLRRQCNVDTTINGYDIDAGTLVVVNSYSFMRDPDTWNRPDEFLPERFLTSYSGNDVVDVDYKGYDCSRYLPFGSGSRACPGASHGLIVAHATVASLAQCFDWKPAAGGGEIDIGMVNGYSGAKTFPLVCYPVLRLDGLEDLCS